MRSSQIWVCGLLVACAGTGPGPKPSPPEPPPPPPPVAWCSYIGSLGTIPATMQCDPSPGYHTVGMIGSRAHPGTATVGRFLPGLVETKRPAGLGSAAYTSRAQLQRGLLMQPSSGALQRWLPSISLRSDETREIGITVRLTNAEFRSLSDLGPTTIAGIRKSPHGSDACENLSDLRHQLCTVGNEVVTDALVATPEVELAALDNRALDFDASATKLLGGGYHASGNGTAHLKLTAEVPLVIAVESVDFTSDPLCTNPVPCAPAEAPPPKPEPIPSPGPVNVVLRAGNGRDQITISVQRYGAPALIATGRYALEFQSADPSQDRDLIDATTSTSLKNFNTSSASGESLTAAGATHVFRAQYHSIFGVFWMNNGTDSWSATISPGDRVIVRWGV